MKEKWAAASAAIGSMWLAVLFIAIFAPNLEATSAGGDTTSIPVAGIVAAGVAFIATIVVASIGFGTPRDRGGLDLERERLERERLELRLKELERRLPSRDETPQDRPHSLLRR
jgi:hypothetical protein